MYMYIIFEFLFLIERNMKNENNLKINKLLFMISGLHIIITVI